MKISLVHHLKTETYAQETHINDIHALLVPVQAYRNVNDFQERPLSSRVNVL